MAKSKSSVQIKTITKVFFYLSVLVAVLLFAVGGLALWASNFTGNMVKSELAAQKIYFPDKGSPALDPAI